MRQFNILIIDDDKDIHEILEIALEDFNHSLPEKYLSQLNVSNCYQGLDGIKFINESVKLNKKIDLIVLDMIMPPGIDGLEVLKHLKMISNQFKIIISSAYHFHNNSDLINISSSYQDVFYLQKPYELADFLNLCRSLLLELNTFSFKDPPLRISPKI